MNILYVFFSDFSGPGEKVFFFLANELVRQGHGVMALVTGDPGSVRDLGMPPAFTMHKLRFRGTGIHPQLQKKILDFQPSIIHCHYIRNVPFRASLELKRLTGAPLLVHHDDAELALYQLRFRRKWEAALSYALMFIGTYVRPSAWRWYNPWLSHWESEIDAHDCLTVELQKYLRDTKGLEVRHIYMGLDLSFINLPPETAVSTPKNKDHTFIAMYNGALSRAWIPDFDMLLRAIDLVKKTGRKIKLIQTGNIYRKGRFIKLIKEYGLGNEIQLQGYVPTIKDLLEYFKQADFFVQPGHNNELNMLRLPSKLQFYLAVGRPVITFAFGFGKVLKDNEEAFLYQKDSAEAMAGKMMEVMDHPSRLDAIGRNAKKKATEIFDVKVTARQFFQYYEEIIERHHE
jgi:glycosyltransferase involved in cell wall biosynthesis